MRSLRNDSPRLKEKPRQSGLSYRGAEIRTRDLQRRLADDANCLHITGKRLTSSQMSLAEQVG